MVPSPAPRHLVLAAIEDGTRVVTIRVLGAYAESLGVRATLLVIVKPWPAFGDPIVFSPKEIRQVVRFFEREGVTHFGMYLMTATLKPYRLLVRALREAGYKGVIMAGGVHVTLCPEESLVEGADFALQGPGELPLKMIFEGADPSTIPGLVWRRDGAVVVNPPSDAQKVDLDALPFPLFRFGRDKALVKGSLRPLTWAVHRKHAEEGRGEYYDIITSRGCPYKCAYCCRVDRGRVRRASVDRVIGELKRVREEHPGIRGINVQDDAFFFESEEWVEEFCRRMKAEIGLPFIVRMIPRFVTPGRMKLLESGGVEYVTMGLEGSNRLNKTLYRRPEDKDSFLKAARAILEAGLYLSIDVLVHNPYETEDDLREVARTLNSLPRPHWGVAELSLTPFPKTPLYEQALKDGMLDRFPTDAYDSMLVPSRLEAYRTPSFWLALYTRLLPVMDPKMASRIIAAGPEDPEAARTVERLVKWTRRMKRLSAFLRKYIPFLYRFLLRRQKRHGAANQAP